MIACLSGFSLFNLLFNFHQTVLRGERVGDNQVGEI